MPSISKVKRDLIRKPNSEIANFAVIRVTPTLSGDQYANNDIFFDTTAISEAVRYQGGSSKLVSCMINSKSNSLFDIELFFCEVNQSVGTINAERSVSDGDWATAKVLVRLTLDSSVNNYNYGNGRVHNFSKANAASNDQWQTQFPIMLKADNGSTSVYCFAFCSGTDVTPEMSDGDIDIVLGIEY